MFLFSHCGSLTFMAALLLLLLWGSVRIDGAIPPPPPPSSVPPQSLSKNTTTKWNFHKQKPVVPCPAESLEELETTASDEFIAQTLDQVIMPSPYSNSIILPYKPQRSWLWKRWHGTILQGSLKKVGLNMVMSLLTCIFLRRICSATWGWGMEPNADACVWVARLKVVDKLWHYQMQLTTFILTFFLTQAYQLWREMYNVGRKIQGRMSDIGVLLATSMLQKDEAFLATVARHLRVYHILTWASQSRQFRVLLTERGLTQMMQRGLLTEDELTTLLQLQLSPTQRQTAVLEWILLQIRTAKEDGRLDDRAELHAVLLEKICILRGTASGISDLTDGRMPLAYAHLVQLLVDTFLFAAPLALFAELGLWSVICVAFMTLFYEGLLDLAKIFLDPLNNEDYCEGGIDMDLGVFIRESNAGSIRWMQGVAELPKGMAAAATTTTTATTATKPTDAALDDKKSKQPQPQLQQQQQQQSGGQESSEM